MFKIVKLFILIFGINLTFIVSASAILNKGVCIKGLSNSPHVYATYSYSGYCSGATYYSKKKYPELNNIFKDQGFNKGWKVKKVYLNDRYLKKSRYE